jgi:plasmid maintenance system antidote protein VapI
MNRELPLLAEIQGPEFLADYLIARCKGEADAVALCWHMRRVKYSMSHAAALMGIPTSHLSNIVAGKKYLPHDGRLTMQRLCGNWAIRQFEDMEEGFTTIRETPEQREIRRLKAELARKAA